MIRQLDHQCRYLDSDPGKQTHHTADAAAVADQAEVTMVDGLAPRPTRRHPAPCWVTEDDHFGRPASDEDERGAPVAVLHRIAELLNDVAWSLPQFAHYSTGYANPTLSASWPASEDYHGAAAGRAERGGVR